MTEKLVDTLISDVIDLMVDSPVRYDMQRYLIAIGVWDRVLERMVYVPLDDMKGVLAYSIIYGKSSCEASEVESVLRSLLDEIKEAVA